MAKRLAPQQRIVEATKFFDLTIPQLHASLDAKGGELRSGVLRVPRVRGQLRLSIRCKSHLFSAWQMSVRLYSQAFDGRIDCIDWEAQFTHLDGTQQTGFHRHVWLPGKGHCEDTRMALAGFSPQSAAEFIRMGFEIMRIEPRREDANGARLPID